MFGLIRKKRIIEEVTKIYAEESVDEAWTENNVYFRMGNANALNCLCSRLGIDILKHINEAKQRGNH